MKVLLLSKAMVVGPSQKKAEELARLPGVELTLVVPPHWHEPRVGVQKLEMQHTTGYEVVVAEMRLNGRHHYHYYPTIGRILREHRPDVFHIDEEPYNFATYHAMQAGKRVGARMCFFTWQNIYKRYPPPFSQFERAVYASMDAAVAGNAEALAVIRAKGFARPAVIIPQFGFDPVLYQPPTPQARPANRLPTVGYIGRLVEEKGVQVLLDAVALLREPYRVEIIGTGYYRPDLEVQAARLGIRDRISFRNSIPARDIPEALSRMDLVVVPSLTRANWKEQFGRVIVEAMACEVPVIGSDSGEIPSVIGDTGIIVPENDPQALALRIHELLDDRVLRMELAARGRQRFLRYFTQEQVAHRYYQLYLAMLYGNVPYEPPPPPPVIEPDGFGPSSYGARQPTSSRPASSPPDERAARRPIAPPPEADIVADDALDYPPGYGDRPLAPTGTDPYTDYNYGDEDTVWDAPPDPPAEPKIPDWWPRR